MSGGNDNNGKGIDDFKKSEDNTQPIKIPRNMDVRRQGQKPSGKRDRFISWLDSRIESIKSSPGYGSSISSALMVQVLVHVRSIYLILRNGKR